MDQTTKACIALLNEDNQYQYHKTFRRHINDLIKFNGSSDYRWNPKIADLYIAVMQTLKHTKGSEFAGKNFKMEPWQIAVIGILSGWEKKTSKGIWVRRFSTANIFLARKNGKTFLSAGLAIADMIVRPEPMGEIIALASKRDQARIAWDSMRSMISAHPDLKKRFHKASLTLTSDIDGTTIKTLGRDSNSEDGANYSTAIVDEYHSHPDSKLFDVVKSSMGARLQPLIIIISTAGFNLGSPLVSELEHSRNILDELVEDNDYFAFLAEPEIDDDPFSEESIRAANPNVGISVSMDYLRAAAETARTRTEKQVEYFTKHLNKFVHASEIFLPSQDWRECGTAYKTKNEEVIPDIREAKRMFIGSDLSKNDDWTSVCTTYMFEDDTVYTESKFFIPDFDIPSREKILRVQLQTWITEGLVQTTIGNTINLNTVYDYIVTQIDLAQELGIEVIHAYDPHRARGLIAKLENEAGFTDNIVVNQGYPTMTEPLAMLLTYVKTRQITHRESKVLNWMAANLEIKRDDYGNQKPNKISNVKKIDGIAAMINTFHAMIPFISETDTGGVFWV